MAYAPVPITNTSGSNVLSQLYGYSLNRKALSILRTKFRFLALCMPDMLEKREGKTRVWYRYTNLAAASNASAEGVVGTSISVPPSKTVSAVAAQYADFLTVSDVLRDTAPDPVLENMADAMGFRAGLTVDNVTRAVFDNETGANQTPLSTYLSVRDFRASDFILQGRNVPYMTNGFYEALTHPYTCFDVVNDPSANGLADIFKYTAPEKAAGIKIEDRGQVTMVANCKITQSTNVLQTSGTPNKWRTYVVGADAVGTVSLAGYEPSKIVDPNKESFRVYTEVVKTPSVANPTGQIGGFVSYNFLHVAKVLEGSSEIGGSYRFITIDTPSSIVS